MNTSGESAFHDAMLEIYERAKKECGYNATRFLQMVRRRGGLHAAKKLLHDRRPSHGISRMQQFKRLDLTVEVLVLDKRWRSLFTAEELEIAQKRLSDLNYRVDMNE